MSRDMSRGLQYRARLDTGIGISPCALSNCRRLTWVGFVDTARFQLAPSTLATLHGTQPLLFPDLWDQERMCTGRSDSELVLAMQVTLFFPFLYYLEYAMETGHHSIFDLHWLK